MVPHVSEHMHYYYRVLTLNVILVATAIAGATSTSIISRMRGNADDGWNYFLGYGIPAGIIWTGFREFLVSLLFPYFANCTLTL